MRFPSGSARRALSTGGENLAKSSPTLRESAVEAADAAYGGNTMKYLLLLIPCVIAVWVPLFNSIGPELFGIPFFYWFQLLLVPVSAIAIFAADRVGKA
jgi:hypothetical protein